mmetsp:Transcript_3100/g.4130  ORF Transcript_3100/g.4130 Transcript_3100/m.4130 type:complete len:241 (-) Transcript_3100:27-749(-)
MQFCIPSTIYYLPPGKKKLYVPNCVDHSTNLEHGVSGKGRDGSRDVVSGNEGHDGDHGKTSVVELTGLLGGDGSGINSREVNWGENNGRQGSSLGVVGSLRFGDKFGNEDGSDDLGLTGIRDGIPGIEGLHAGEGFEGDVLGKHTREVDSRSLDDVSGGGKHGNTGVLKLGSAEPKKSLVGSNGGKAEGIESTQRSSGSGKVLQRHGDRGGNILLGGRGESSGRAGESKESSSDLHLDLD